jgi:L-rhamnose mutarotase
MKFMKRYSLICDLKNDPELITEYRKYHEKIWPEITQSILAKGIFHMEIYLHKTRMFMIMEVNDDFSFEKGSAMDKANPRVQEWENLMWKYQQSPPGAAKGEKWVLMEKIFDLVENT